MDLQEQHFLGCYIISFGPEQGDLDGSHSIGNSQANGGAHLYHPNKVSDFTSIHYPITYEHYKTMFTKYQEIIDTKSYSIFNDNPDADAIQS
jgi:hypothetical protein